MVGASEVAFGAGDADGEHCLRIVAVPGNNEAMVVHRRRNDIVGEAGTFPKLRPARQVIAAHTFSGANNHLGLAFVNDYERRGPGGLFIASGLPENFAGGLVESVQERVTLLIPTNEES